MANKDGNNEYGVPRHVADALKEMSRITRDTGVVFSGGVQDFDNSEFNDAVLWNPEHEMYETVHLRWSTGLDAYCKREE